MVTRKNLDIVRARVEEINKKLLADDKGFNKAVSLVHGDGSTFFVNYAYLHKEVEDDDEYICIISEHHRPLVYALEELAQYYEFETSTNGYNTYVSSPPPKQKKTKKKKD